MSVQIFLTRHTPKRIRVYLLLIVLFGLILYTTTYNYNSLFSSCTCTTTAALLQTQTTNSSVQQKQKLNSTHENVLPFRTILLDRRQLFDTLNKQDRDDLINRYNVNVSHRNSSLLSLGVLRDVIDDMIQLQNRYSLELTTIYGITPNSELHSPTHYFFELKGTPIQVVVLHPVKNYLWIGKVDSSIPEPFKSEIFYGQEEQIFDVFNSNNFDAFNFLAQTMTCTFMRCTAENSSYVVKTNQTDSTPELITQYTTSIKNMKTLMSELRWQFWVVCGTLLGWYRQCSVIPYTTDLDFATWFFNAAENAIEGTNEKYIVKRTNNSSLKLWYRWGHANFSSEYTFYDEATKRKADMFFIYPNGTHFLMPFHVPPQYAYVWYQPYKLCSVDLLGYKVLASCEPEKTIVTEYGKTWREPVSKYNYYSSPTNVIGAMPYKSNLTQMRDFYKS